MRLTGLTVSGVGRFDRPFAVEGFGPGVNVLAAENEAGKSTLFKAIRTCLFKRHTAVDEGVRALETAGAQLPVEIAVDFDVDGAAYRIAKSFMRSKSAVLIRDGREIARGRAADETVWDLLGIAPGSGRAIDEAAFGMLWVGQTESFTLPTPSETANSQLSGLIEAEVGALIGGERARAVLAQVKDELEGYLTPAGKVSAGGPLGRAQQALDELSGHEAQLAGRLAELDRHLGELSAKRAERQAQADPAKDAELAEGIAAAKAELEAARAAAQRLARLEEAERFAAIQRDGALRALDETTQLATRIDTTRQQLADLRARMAALAPGIAAGEAARAETAAKIAATTERMAQLDARLRALRQVGEVQAKTRERDGLASRLAQLSDIGRRLVALNGEIAALKVTQAQVDSLDKLNEDRIAVAARLQAGAPHLAIAPSAAGAGRITIGTAPVNGPVEQAVLGPVTVTLGDLGTLTITPAAGQGAADARRLGEIDGRIADLVAAASAASPAEMRQLNDRRRQLDGDRQAIVAELRALQISERELAATATEIRTTLAAIDSAVADALARHGLDALPEAALTQAEIATLGPERDAAETERQRLDAMERQQTRSLEASRAEHGPLAGRLEQMEATLAADLGLLPDAERADRLADLGTRARAAEAALAAANGALALERADAPNAARLEQLDNTLTRREQARDNRQARLKDLDRDIARLEGQIEAAGGEGLGERLAITAEERALAAREVARMTAHVEALRLVQSSVQAALDEGRERYHAPLHAALAPFLNDLFPAAELALGEGFGVEGLKRGGLAEDLDRLSDGTREQIAVLVRLAMAAMLAGGGREVPVILDDALVYSDDARIGRMFDILTRAGGNSQVIVLTCRIRAFEELGGRPLSIRRKEGAVA